MAMTRYICATCQAKRIVEDGEETPDFCRNYYNGKACFGVMRQEESLNMETQYVNRPYPRQ
jgi:hypothetical protein